jgi:hypothetical protein
MCCAGFRVGTNLMIAIRIAIVERDEDTTRIIKAQTV